jgi:hypothetical protein
MAEMKDLDNTPNYSYWVAVWIPNVDRLHSYSS